MGLSDLIITQPEVNPPRLLINGVAGVGKTTLAAQIPKAIFLQAEDGADKLSVARFPKANTYVDIIDQMRMLMKEDHDYRMVVIDSVSSLEHLAHAQVCEDGGKTDISDFGYGAGYDKALAYFKRIMDGLNWLRDNKNMGFCFIGHVEVRQHNDPTMDPFDQFVLRAHKKVAALVIESVDAALFAQYKIHVSGEKGEKKRGIDTGKRVLHTTQKPGWIAKNRYDLDETIPMDIESLKDVLTW